MKLYELEQTLSSYFFCTPNQAAVVSFGARDFSGVPRNPSAIYSATAGYGSSFHALRPLSSEVVPSAQCKPQRRSSLSLAESRVVQQQQLEQGDSTNELKCLLSREVQMSHSPIAGKSNCNVFLVKYK